MFMTLAWFGMSIIGSLIQLLAARSNIALERYFGLVALAVSLAAAVVAAGIGSLFLLPALLISLVHSAHALRLITRHLPPRQRRSMALKELARLSWYQNVWFIVLVAAAVTDIGWRQQISSILIFGLAALIIAWIKTAVVLRRAGPQPSSGTGATPTLSLLIPARNEDHALTESLRRAVDNDYPKYEILVLDDCSQDKTAQIIRSFAGDGVRFVKGDEPSVGWLGKNQAYQRLFEASSGELLLFCGVDVHLERRSISRLVAIMEGRGLDMISVMPQRRHSDFGATLLQPLRYSWQLVSGSKRRPPVLSSCWLIRRRALTASGGFHGLKNAVVPERSLAMSVVDKYRFVIAEEDLGVTTRKRVSSQLETAIRNLYPSLKRSMTASALMILLIYWVLLFPIVIIAAGYSPSDILWRLALSVIAVAVALQAWILRRIQPKSAWLAPLQLPIGVLLTCYTVIESLRRYEFSSVAWKGRNICIPIYDDHQATEL